MTRAEMIGKNIREARKAKGMTQTELATTLGYTLRAVQNWEQGNRVPRVDVFGQIADVLGVDANFLIHGKKEEDK